MTSRERKIALLKKLIADIKKDLEAVDNLTEKIQNNGKEIINKTGPVEEKQIMLLAAYLHHFYTGIEAIIERVAGEIDGGTGKRGDYHRELLRSMTLEIEGIRPPVITDDLAEELDDYRKFRHLFRHAYAGEMRWKKMSHLVENAGVVAARFEASMKKFIGFLEQFIAKL